jgi:phosphatidylglycerophosphate synthase
VARVTGRQSDWGGYQDIVLDHVIYAVLPLGVAWNQGQPPVFLACAVLQASYFVNTISWCYLAALLEKRQAGCAQGAELTSVTMPGAWIEGTETTLFFSGFILFPGWVGPLFWLKATLVSVGVLQRWTFARRVLARG